MTGFEPAGGCTVWVSCIIILAKPTAIAMNHQSVPKKYKKNNPHRVHKKCPKIRFFAFEKGDWGKPNSKTQEAPKEPNIRGCRVYSLKNATEAMAMLAKQPL